MLIKIRIKHFIKIQIHIYIHTHFIHTYMIKIKMFYKTIVDSLFATLEILVHVAISLFLINKIIFLIGNQ